MKMIVKVINDNGLEQIKAFLIKHHASGGTDLERHILESWGYDAEYEMSNGRPPCIHLRSWEAIDGCARDFLITNEGIDTREIDNGDGK